MSFARATASAIAAAALAAGCTLAATDRDSCQDLADCQAVFGLGAVCGAEGFCELIPVQPRCTLTEPPDLLERPELYRDRIVIGTVSDRGQAIFRRFERAARIAVIDITDEGGIPDDSAPDGSRGIALVMCTSHPDTDGDPMALVPDIDDGLRDLEDTTEVAVDYLINVIGVPAVIGPARSNIVQDTFEKFGDTGTLFISPSATSPTLSDLETGPFTDENPGLLWRTAAPDTLQGVAVATDMRTVGNGRTAVVDNAAVIHIDGAYGRGLATAFQGEFTARGGTATLFEYTSAGIRNDHIATVGANATFTEVFFISNLLEDTVDFLGAAAADVAWDNRGLFLPDAADSKDDVFDVADPLRFPQVRGSRPGRLDPAVASHYQSFLTRYRQEYTDDEPDSSFVPNAYDAAYMVAYGLAWASLREGEITGRNIARGLRQLSSGMGVTVGASGWRVGVPELEAGRSIDLVGTSGDIDYDPATEETRAPIEIWRIEMGNAVGIYNINP